jgi:hypothetical protein
MFNRYTLQNDTLRVIVFNLIYFQDDFEYGKYDGAHTFHEVAYEGTQFSII